MKELYLITGNKSKFEEAREILKDTDIELKQEKIDLIEIQSIEQEQVVIDKAEQAFQKLKKPVLVDDTGIFFEEYIGFPGVYTKPLFHTLGLEGLQRLLTDANRNAYFRTLICYKNEKTTKIFSGIWKGKITKDISKMFNPDWQYNSIFIPEGFKRPLSEISMEERAKFSHRKKAMDELKKYFQEKKMGEKCLPIVH